MNCFQILYLYLLKQYKFPAMEFSQVVNCFQILYLYLLKQSKFRENEFTNRCELLSDFVSLPPETVLGDKKFRR